MRFCKPLICLISRNFLHVFFIFSVSWGEVLLLQTRIFHWYLLCCFVSVHNRAYCPDSDKHLPFISPRSTGRSKFTISNRTAALELQESSSSSVSLLADKFSSVWTPELHLWSGVCSCACVCKSLERSPNDAAYKAGRNEVKSPLTDLAADDKWMWPWQTLWKSGEVVVSGVGAASSAAHSSHPGIVHRHLKAKKTVSLQQRLLLCFTNVQLMNNTSFEYSQCISMETDFIPPKKNNNSKVITCFSILYKLISTPSQM